MSTLKELKEYLVGEGGYLLNDDNNGKTVMLSGVWGSGKTHFWQNEIEDDLTKKLNDRNKACVYVSLYGKDNIEAIKNEILFKAYESIKDENKLAKRAISAFGFGSRLLSVSVGGVRANTGAVGDVVESFFESKKIDEAESFLADGGLICLDDFERKSKHIDLNDLFGFIAQLAIDMNCKIVIILNSDVFEGEEANIFKTVKEKTVNKFFYFEPGVKELFDSIYDSNSKYEKLDKHREVILNAIEETEELNARIYIQILDNCLEWIDKGHDSGVFRALVLNTVCFIRNHFLLEKFILNIGYTTPLYRVMENYPTPIMDWFLYNFNINEEMQEFYADIRGMDIVFRLKQWISKKNNKGSFEYKESTHQQYLTWIDYHMDELKALYKYGYLFYNFEQINDLVISFVKTGLLSKKVDIE